jgi:hypothetical protein
MKTMSLMIPPLEVRTLTKTFGLTSNICMTATISLQQRRHLVAAKFALVVAHEKGNGEVDIL